MSNELPQEDKELIAKIDERLKHYKLITDNEQADKEEYVECINNHGFEDHLIFENIYKVIGKDDEYYELIIKGLQSGFYVKKRFKPSTKEAYLKQFLPDN